ncbi:hypothetical protein EDB85DRAFT_2145859 [Lactarius pseudohatsudake]|nr:hypothetical protein EDB85DRAFT_2145859 [Lactarius pseudohatsudake]
MSRGPVALVTLTALGAYYYYSLLEQPLAVQDLGGRLGALAGLLGAETPTPTTTGGPHSRRPRARLLRRSSTMSSSSSAARRGSRRVSRRKSTLVFGGPTYNRNLKSVPQERLGGRIVDETVAWVLRGSSMISDLLWQRPSREEFDPWGRELGNGPTCSWDALEPYYRHAENWTGNSFGRDGPMQISYNNYYPGLIDESVAAANALGETGNATGFFTPFEPNANRKNLVVLTGAEATKVLFEPRSQDKKSLRVAEAVEFVSNGNTYQVHAKKEVIAVTSTFKTPQLTHRRTRVSALTYLLSNFVQIKRLKTGLLSGIGDRSLLKSIGIETLIDLPGVEENPLDQTYSDRLRCEEARINPTFAQEQIALQPKFMRRAAMGTGVLTYDTAATGSIPLQPVLTKEEIGLLPSYPVSRLQRPFSLSGGPVPAPPQMVHQEKPPALAKVKRL